MTNSSCLVRTTRLSISKSLLRFSRSKPLGSFGIQLVLPAKRKSILLMALATMTQALRRKKVQSGTARGVSSISKNATTPGTSA